MALQCAPLPPLSWIALGLILCPLLHPQAAATGGTYMVAPTPALEGVPLLVRFTEEVPDCSTLPGASTLRPMAARSSLTRT